MGQFVRRFEEPVSWQQVLEDQGLGWNVTRLGLFHETSNSHGILRKVKDRQALVRDDTGDCLGIVAPRYQIIQNRELFSFVDTLVDERQASFVGAGELKGGQGIYAIAKLPYQIEARRGDLTDVELLLRAYHDGKHSASVTLITTRLVCTNQLAGANFPTFTVKHQGDTASKIRQAETVLGYGRDFAADYQRQVDALVSHQLRGEIARAYVEEVFPEPEEPESGEGKVLRNYELALARRDNTVGKVLELINSGTGNDGSSLWDAFNGVSEYVQYHQPRRRAKSNPLWHLTGQGGSTISRAWDIALEFVE